MRNEQLATTEANRKALQTGFQARTWGSFLCCFSLILVISSAIQASWVSFVANLFSMSIGCSGLHAGISLKSASARLYFRGLVVLITLQIVLAIVSLASGGAKGNSLALIVIGDIIVPLLCFGSCALCAYRHSENTLVVEELRQSLSRSAASLGPAIPVQPQHMFGFMSFPSLPSMARVAPIAQPVPDDELGNVGQDDIVTGIPVSQALYDSHSSPSSGSGAIAFLQPQSSASGHGFSFQIARHPPVSSPASLMHAPAQMSSATVVWGLPFDGPIQPQQQER